MVNTVNLGSTGTVFALNNLSVYSRVDNSNNDDDAENSSNESYALNTNFLTDQRKSALENLSSARAVNNQAKSDINSIKSLLTDLSDELSSFSALVGKSGSANVTSRTSILNDINTITQNISNLPAPLSNLKRFI